MQITPFDFSGKTIRTIVDNKEVWFVVVDVCRYLALTNPRAAIRHLKDNEKADVTLNDGRQKRTYNIINEPGLYRLLLRTNSKKAEKFQHWVLYDLLPTIRKTGSYSLKPMTRIEMLEQLLKNERKMEVDKPKVEYFENVSKAVNAHSFNRAAKILGWGRNTLMKTLRADRILMANNMPFQGFINAGRFIVKERTFEIEGVRHITSTTFVTGKGMQWLSQRYNTRIQLELFASKPTLLSRNKLV